MLSQRLLNLVNTHTHRDKRSAERQQQLRQRGQLEQQIEKEIRCRGFGVRCRNSCNYILNYLTKQLATNPDTDSDADADGDGDGDTAVDSDPEEYEKSKADQQI